MCDEAGRSAVAAGTVAGLAIALVTGGRILARGYGTANLETGTPASEDSVFRIASVTKTFTATAVMLLREQKQLRLEQPLADFYPSIPGAAAITLRQLLSHTSGLRDYVRGGLPADVGRDWATADDFAAGVARMEQLQDFPAGTRFSYSNAGYILLGGVIEKASGISYEQFLADRIFRPCGMARTAVDHVTFASILYLWLNLTGLDPPELRGLTQRIFSSVNSAWPMVAGGRLLLTTKGS